MTIWLPLKLRSNNQLRHLHWSKVRKLDEEAKAAWLCALRSSPLATTTLIKAMSALEQQKLSKTQSPTPSELMTETHGSDGSTIPCKHTGSKAP